MAEGEEEKIVAGAGGADEKKAIVLAGAGDEEEKAVVLVGAGDEEDKQEGAAGGGGNGAWFTPPPGFRFTPGEDELVIYYLLPKLQGREHVPNHSIIEADVYESHPDVLTGTPSISLVQRGSILARILAEHRCVLSVVIGF
jgi:hypothetical protein